MTTSVSAQATGGDAAVTPVTFADAIASRRLVFFCGKGGAGKSTLAAAAALARGAGVLLGTDPAGTLPRIIGGGGPGGVDVRQVDAATLLEAFRSEHARTIASIIEGGTYLDAADAAALCQSSLPGADEVLALLELADVIERAGGATVFVDTAPSAHALRLLSLPDAFDAALDVLETMRGKARAVESAFSGGVRETEADRFLARLRERVACVRAALGDPARSGFVAVALPEPSAVAEAGRLAGGLEAVGLGPIAVVVNGREDAACCERGARRVRAGDDAVARLAERFPGVPVFAVPRLESEPVGVDALRSLGNELCRSTAVVPVPVAVPVPDPARPAVPALDRRLILVGGKGGVGKTTIAASIAMNHPARRVLLASIGGGSGLSRALGTTLGDEPRPVPGATNLEAAEIDARARFEKIKEEFRDDVERALDSLIGGSRNLDLTYDRAVIRGLLDLAPPGVDEIAGLAFLVDAAGRYDALVIDCAPTGHLVRFLEMPRVAREWLGLAIRLLAKYPELAEASAVERTLALLRRVRAVAEMLSDPARTALVAVTLAEPIPADETLRLRDRATAAGVAPALFVVNRIEPATPCPRCGARRARQLDAADALDRAIAPARALRVEEVAA